MHVDDVGDTFPVRFPQVFAQHPSRNDLAGKTHQEFEQAELGGS